MGLKRCVGIVLLCVLLTGCAGQNQELDRVMTFRAALLAGSGCSFDASVTADYGDEVYTFSMACLGDGQGNLTFSVTEPETISGITGSISNDGGKLTFDDKALAFALLADGQVTPVSAPWLLVKTLRGGYVTSCTMEEDLLRVSIDDSYQEDALHLDIWFGQGDNPVRAEILWDDRRILSLEVKNFEIL